MGQDFDLASTQICYISVRSHPVQAFYNTKIFRMVNYYQILSAESRSFPVQYPTKFVSEKCQTMQ